MGTAAVTVVAGETDTAPGMALLLPFPISKILSGPGCGFLRAKEISLLERDFVVRKIKNGVDRA